MFLDLFYKNKTKKVKICNFWETFIPFRRKIYIFNVSPPFKRNKLKNLNSKICYKTYEIKKN